MMSTEARNLRIVALAQERMRPQAIAAEVGVCVDVVYNQIRSARLAGIDIPHFSGGVGSSLSVSRPVVGGRSLQPQATLRRPEHARPREEEPEAPRISWTEADDAKLRDLARRGVPLTGMAAFLRKPYRMVIEAAERLGLFEARQQERIAS